jgi:hypothetical protein
MVSGDVVFFPHGDSVEEHGGGSFAGDLEGKY